LIGYGNIEDHENSRRVSAELAFQFPESRRAFLAESFALRALGKPIDGDKLAGQRLQRIPDDVDAMHVLVWDAIVRQEYPAAYELTRKIADAGKAESGDWNQLAWFTLFFRRTDGPDLDAAIKASQLAQNNASILHTLGCVYAELGKTKDAREVLIQAMDLLELDEPNADYWYAFGRIAEQHGEREIAADDYAKVNRPTHDWQIPSSTYSLAAVRTHVLSEGEQKVSQEIKH